MKVVDMHCDSIMLISEYGENSLRKNEHMLDFEKMQEGDYLLQCFAMFVPLKRISDTPYAHVNMMIDKYYEQMNANADLILPAFNYDDIIKNNEAGFMSGLLTIEEGGVVEGSIDKLHALYDRGVRMITLTWNFENGIGYPNFELKKDEKPDFTKPNTTKGLTPFGIKMVKEMEKLGMIIDVSHLGDKGFYDVYENTTKPFVASHSNARSVCNHVRNMTDDMIKKLASRGGVMGINYCSAFVNDGSDGSNSEYTKVSDLIKHIKYIKDLVGIDYIGLGSDFDGIGDNVEMNKASKMGLLAEEMRKAGFTEEEIEKVFYKNVLRVFKEVLK